MDFTGSCPCWSVFSFFSSFFPLFVCYKGGSTKAASKTVSRLFGIHLHVSLKDSKLATTFSCVVEMGMSVFAATLVWIGLGI